jgi:ABC-type transport system involved in multi-copper enzyme maturation permease subunit
MNPFRFLFRNPVVLKELRGRMRGSRAFVVMTGYLSLVGGFALLLYMSTVAAASSTSQVDGGVVGRTLFVGVVGIQLFLVTFIAPAFTAGAISGERERQTYDLLKTTLLPESHFVMGKLVSALAYVFLLLLAAIPLQSLSFILGGTDLPDILIALLTLFVTSIFLGMMGVYFSARMKRTLSASVATYGLALTLVVGTLVLLAVFLGISNLFLDDMQQNSSPITWNGRDVEEEIEWAILIGRGALVCSNPVSTLWVTRDYLISQQSPWTFTYTFQSGNTTTLPSPWIVFSLNYLLLSALFFGFSTRHVRKVDEF